MADIRLFNTHRNWEDWLAIALGVVIGISPWLISRAIRQSTGMR